MKFDLVNTLIALIIAALLAWGAYAITSVEGLKLVTTITTFVSLSVVGVYLLGGIVIEAERASFLIKTASTSFYVLLLILNGIFSFFDFSIPLYIILNGLILLIFISVYRGIMKSGI